MLMTKYIPPHSTLTTLLWLWCLGIPTTTYSQTPGDWEIRVQSVIKKPARSNPDDLKTNTIIEYRYLDGIPPHRFLVAVASPQQAVPQTIAEYTEFGIAIADIYEVCPRQFSVLEEEDETVAIASLALKANFDFIPTRNPGKPFQQLILHDWGNLYEGLGGVSLFNFGTSLQDHVLSAGTLFREGRCAEASPEECVEIVHASLRTREPTPERLEQNAHGGQSITPCPAPPVVTPIATDGNPDENFAQVLFVTARQTNDGTWVFDTTVRHNDQGFDHYADAWEVVDLESGEVLAERILTHPHDTEQPFTRSQSAITISDGTQRVVVRSKCNVHGFGGQEVIVDLTEDVGEHFEVSRLGGML